MSAITGLPLIFLDQNSYVGGKGDYRHIFAPFFIPSLTTLIQLQAVTQLLSYSYLAVQIEYRRQPVMISIESCLNYAGSLAVAVPQTPAKHIGGGVAAVFVTAFLLKKVYKTVQVGRNAKKVKTKRENLAARKRGLEERSPLSTPVLRFPKHILTQFTC